MSNINMHRTASPRPVDGPAGRENKPANLSGERARKCAMTTLRRFFKLQSTDGYWVFDLEADVTIPSEYYLFKRFMGISVSDEVRDRLRTYILSKQLPDGGWPLYDVDGHADLSATVKAYFALKVMGEDFNSGHMCRARNKVLAMGGAEKANVFTRILLAIFGQISWDLPPAMPLEIMLLPKWFFFNLSKVSYWSRTVVVPLLILYHLRPVCHLGPYEGVRELFVTVPEKLGHLDSYRGGVGFLSRNWRKNAFLLLDRVLKRVLPLVPGRVTKKALDKAEAWTRAHMQGVGGIGAIYPAMANAVMALDQLGYDESDPDFARGLQAVDDLVVDHFAPESSVHGTDLTLVTDNGTQALPEPEVGKGAGLSADTGQTMVQPCVSPIWDTCLTLSAIMEAGAESSHSAVRGAADWLFSKQVFTRGDWADKAGGLPGGGWAFQFENALYPDLDDTAMVVMALARAGALDDPKRHENIRRAVNWIVGMQCSDGGWAAFDIDNNYLYLNDIPFADHGALLDPPTEDLTARCIEMLGVLGYPRDYKPIQRGIEFLKRQQCKDGSWFGRWGVNYIYGTWSVLAGLRQAGEDMGQGYVRRAVGWFKERQNPDGGWGETCDSYAEPHLAGRGPSTPSQTAWALLGLMAAGEVHSRAVSRGVSYLTTNQDKRGAWDERYFTGTGFPRVFYLRYHGYSQYFPMWALGVYSRFVEGEPTVQIARRLSSPEEIGLDGKMK